MESNGNVRESKREEMAIEKEEVVLPIKREKKEGGKVIGQILLMFVF